MNRVLQQFDLRVVRIPLVNRFRDVLHRDAVLIGGPAGWGEFSPFPNYRPPEAKAWLEAALEAATVPGPRLLRDAVEVNATIPAVDPDVARKLVDDAGCRTVKVKVAQAGIDFAQDVERVSAVREGLGPSGGLRVDVNGAWSVEEAVEKIKRLGQFDLEYVEQPVATLDEMISVRAQIEVPIAADESIRLGGAPDLQALAEAASVLVLKVQPLGGVSAVIDIADAWDGPVVISSALETSVGLAQGVRAACAVESDLAAGLATRLMMVGDVVATSVTPIGGRVTARAIEPEEELLALWNPAPEVAEACLARLDTVAALLDIENDGP